jgi:hypothetical protein
VATVAATLAAVRAWPQRALASDSIAPWGSSRLGAVRICTAAVSAGSTPSMATVLGTATKPLLNALTEAVPTDL